MKTLTSVIPSVVLCVGLTLAGCAANGTVSGGPFAQEALGQSVGSHETSLQQHRDKVVLLEHKIKKLEHRLDMLKHSYRDPKGFKRQSWKRLLGQWQRDLRDVHERIVWHEEQINRLNQ